MRTEEQREKDRQDFEDLLHAIFGSRWKFAIIAFLCFSALFSYLDVSHTNPIHPLPDCEGIVTGQACDNLDFATNTIITPLIFGMISLLWGIHLGTAHGVAGKKLDKGVSDSV